MGLDTLGRGSDACFGGAHVPLRYVCIVGFHFLLSGVIMVPIVVFLIIAAAGLVISLLTYREEEKWSGQPIREEAAWWLYCRVYGEPDGMC